ncbi:MAG: sigma-70 family RNA polymerase sigma factor, partial [Oscillospiraceae bacterium]|nr:sigma-70 family RNA polymerase sigma factor [Oscillospiraceae bacterium]
EEDADRKMLHESISVLNPRERRIIELRFGLNGTSEYTQKEVAEIMGISQSYISRLEKRTISRLKKEMAKRML